MLGGAPEAAVLIWPVGKFLLDLAATTPCLALTSGPPVHVGVPLRTDEPVRGVHRQISGGLLGQPTARRTHSNI